MIVNYEVLLFIGVVSVCLYSVCHWVALRKHESRLRAGDSPDMTPGAAITVADKQRAVLHYRVELMRKQNAVIERRQAEERAMNLVEDFSIAESLKLKKAIAAAKQGASAGSISERFELTENEAELIVSIHGTRRKDVAKTVH